MAPIRKNLAVEALEELWLRVVREYSNARRDAQHDGAAIAELSLLDLSYALQIDIAYRELKVAESLDRLRSSLSPRSLFN